MTVLSRDTACTQYQLQLSVKSSQLRKMHCQFWWQSVVWLSKFMSSSFTLVPIAVCRHFQLLFHSEDCSKSDGQEQSRPLKTSMLTLQQVIPSECVSFCWSKHLMTLLYVFPYNYVTSSVHYPRKKLQTETYLPWPADGKPRFSLSVEMKLL